MGQSLCDYGIFWEILELTASWFMGTRKIKVGWWAEWFLRKNYDQNVSRNSTPYIIIKINKSKLSTQNKPVLLSFHILPPSKSIQHL